MRMDIAALAKKQPMCTLSVFSYIPPRRAEPQELSYFYRRSKNTGPRCTYDALFHFPEGYDNKLHKDIWKHAKGRGLHVNSEEKMRPVAVLSSSAYGREPPLSLTYAPRHSFGCINHLQSRLFRKNGIVLYVEEGYGTVTPV